MVFYHNRVRNKFNTNNKLLGGGIKRNLSNMVIGNNNNRYISGSGVGAVSSSNRRALKRKASTCKSNCPDFEAQYNFLLNRFLDIINGKIVINNAIIFDNLTIYPYNNNSGLKIKYLGNNLVNNDICNNYINDASLSSSITPTSFGITCLTGTELNNNKSYFINKIGIDASNTTTYNIQNNKVNIPDYNVRFIGNIEERLNQLINKINNFINGVGNNTTPEGYTIFNTYDINQGNGINNPIFNNLTFIASHSTSTKYTSVAGNELVYDNFIKIPKTSNSSFNINSNRKVTFEYNNQVYGYIYDNYVNNNNDISYSNIPFTYNYGATYPTHLPIRDNSGIPIIDLSINFTNSTIINTNNIEKKIKSIENKLNDIINGKVHFYNFRSYGLMTVQGSSKDFFKYYIRVNNYNNNNTNIPQYTYGIFSNSQTIYYIYPQNSNNNFAGIPGINNSYIGTNNFGSRY